MSLENFCDEPTSEFPRPSLHHITEAQCVHEGPLLDEDYATGLPRRSYNNMNRRRSFAYGIAHDDELGHRADGRTLQKSQRVRRNGRLIIGIAIVHDAARTHHEAGGAGREPECQNGCAGDVLGTQRAATQNIRNATQHKHGCTSMPLRRIRNAPQRIRRRPAAPPAAPPPRCLASPTPRRPAAAPHRDEAMRANTQT